MNTDAKKVEKKAREIKETLDKLMREKEKKNHG
jgi:hypothetical protein